MVNPISESTYGSLSLTTLRLVSNLGKLLSSEERDDRRQHFSEAENNLQTFCLLCGWSFSNLVEQREANIPEGWNPEGLLERKAAKICGLVVEASSRSLSEEEINDIQIELADIYLEMRFFSVL